MPIRDPRLTELEAVRRGPRPRRSRRPRLLLAALAACACGGETSDPSGPAGSAPRVLAILPARVVPGQAITIAGVGFGDVPDSIAVTIGGVPADVRSLSDREIVTAVPAGVDPGDADVVVAVAGVTTRGIVAVVPPGPVFESLSAGSGFTCGARAGGGASCWGFGGNGQLGDGRGANHSASPVPVSGGEAFRGVTAGAFHACALDAGGRAWCWGRNGAGQIGDGTRTARLVPVPLAGNLELVMLSAGAFHTCGLAADGRAWCWGANDSGQLGSGDFTLRETPVPVAGGPPLASISSGSFHVCGLDAAGAAWCWGENSNGELGRGSTGDQASPVPVAGGHVFAEVSAGKSPLVGLEEVGEHTCARDALGEAWCWGFNQDGQLGNRSRTASSLPVRVVLEEAVGAIAAGAFHSCALTLEGRALCWGANDSGQLGSAVQNPSLDAPVQVLGGLRFRSLTAGGASKTALRAVRAHTCALTPEGLAYCWGQNGSGQLGSGTTQAQFAPVPVSGGA
jgi:alpha-tubulin suppressor-like RCC1 family protein